MMYGLRSAQGRAVAAGAVGLLLLAGVATTATVGRAPGTTLWLAIGLSGAAFVLVTATVALVIASTVRPLAALRASARAIAAGDPEARARVSGPEEVTSLAQAFNEMTDALAAKTQEFIDTTNLTGDIIIRVDKHGRFTFLNDAACQFYGKPREQLLGVEHRDYVHPDDMATILQMMRERKGTTEPVRGFVNRMITPMGTRVVEWNGYGLFDEEGHYAGLQGTGRDITRRKRAEETLRESEERFRSLSASAPIGIFLTDPLGRCTYANPRLLAIGRLTLQEALGDGWHQVLHPDDRQAVLEGAAKASREGRDFSGEFRILTREGGLHWVRVHTGPLLSAEGGHGGCAGAVEDITERKRAEVAVRESEEKFRNIFRSASDAIIYLDTSGVILDVNDKAVELFGGPREELLGKQFTRVGVFRRADLPAIMSSFASTLAGEQASVQICMKNIKGEDRFLDCSASTLKTDGKTRNVVVVAARDITERKRAEKALQKAREEIESRVERRVQQVNGYGLTFRELAVLHLVAAGESDKEIATVLSISPLTAHKHIANILGKMGAASRTEAGVRALREGLLD